MKTLIKKFISKISNGIYHGIGFILTLGVFGLVYAALSWIPQTPVSSGSPLTSTIWNDMINNVGYVKENVETVASKLGTQTEGKMCTSVGGKVTCSTDIPAAGATTWDVSGTNVYYNGGNVGIGITTPATGVKLDVQGGKFKLKGIILDHVTGTNPTCPVGGILMKKWNPKTCSGVAAGSTSCTTSSTWGVNAITCGYTICVMTCSSATCTADSWSEAICIGN